jgi:hypothetical protein
MRKTLTVIGVALTLALGYGLGAATTEPAAAKPIIKTRTVTETVEVETTPGACLDAIDASESISEDTVAFATMVGDDLLPLVLEAAKAGASLDVSRIEGVTAELDDITGEINTITASVQPKIAEFNTAKALCRASR